MNESVEKRTPAEISLSPNYRGRILSELIARVLFIVAGIVFLYGTTAYALSKRTFDKELERRLLGIAGLATLQIPGDLVVFLESPGALEGKVRKIFEKIKTVSKVENLLLLDPQGRVLAEASGAYRFSEKYWPLSLDEQAFLEAGRGRETASLLFQGREGGVYKVAYVPVKDSQQHVVAVLGVEASADFMEGLQRFARFLVVFAVVALAAAAGAMMVFGRRLVRPIREMAKASEKITFGDFNVQVPENISNELGALGRAFNQMVRRLQEHNEYILESMASGLVVVDLSGKITTWNPVAARLFQLPEEAVLQRPWREVFRGKPEIRKIIEKGETSNEAYILEKVVLPGEEKKIFRFQIAPLLGEQKKRLGTEFLFTDETKMHELEERIQETEKLAAIGELAAGIAHEIRNPLGAVRGFVEILEKRLKKNTEEYECLADISKEIDILNRIVTDFLIFARPMRPDFQKTSWKEIWEHLEPLVEKEGREKNIRMQVNAGADAVFLGDVEQLRRALLNILFNAFQASSPKGMVRVTWHAGDGGRFQEELAACKTPLPERIQERFWCWLRVEDEGPGIAPEAYAQLFRPFFTTKTQGFGLGLSITKKIMDAHHGWVGAAAGAGGGAVFWLALSNEEREEEEHEYHFDRG